MADPRIIKSWVIERVGELKGSINPLTDKKYTRQQIVDQIRSEGGKVSFDFVARKGPTTPNKTRADYSELYPDLRSKLLSKNETIARRAMETAKRRVFVANNPEAAKAADVRFRESPHGRAYKKTIKISKEKSAAKTGVRRARKRKAYTAEAKSPPFKTEIDDIYRAAKVIPGEYNVDHIQRLVDDGLHHPKNLQLLSVELHKLKTALENAGKFEEAARVGQFNEYSLEPKLRSLLAENIKAPGLMSFLKTVSKVGAKALPFVGYGAGAWGASEYSKSGNPILSAISGASAIPVLGDVLGIPLAAAELIGLGVNRDRELIRKRKEERGLLNYEPPKRKPGRGYGLLNY